MKRFQRLLFVSALLFTVWIPAFAQQQSNSKGQEKKAAATSSISGRVTLGDRPMPKAVVGLYRANEGVYGQPLHRTNTDADGNYRLANLPAGTYTLLASFPGYISQTNPRTYSPGTPITLEDGETIDNINFALKRGGVITGRLLDDNGRPVVGYPINLSRVDERGQNMGNPGMSGMQQFQMMQTDDRGVYRIYGLPAGRYRASVGSYGQAPIRLPLRGDYYKATFYPNTDDQAKAEILELSEGGELENIDITLSRTEKTYSMTGRVVDATTGQPLSGVFSAYGKTVTAGNRQMVNNYISSGTPSGADGAFRIEGLTPGQYMVYITQRPGPSNDGGYFSTPVSFEITEENVSGIELRASRGSSLSGTLEFEGEDANQTFAKLSPFRIMAQPVYREGRNATPIPQSVMPMNPAPDGSFTMQNLQPGTITFRVLSNKAPRGVRLVRMEVNGEDRTKGVEIRSGEQLTGVRVILAYDSGVVLGEVKLENGSLPENTRLFVTMRPANVQPSPGNPSFGDFADPLGRFRIEGVRAGDYDIEASVVPFSGELPPTSRPPAPPRVKPVKQRISVANGAKVKVTLVLDLSSSGNDR